MRHFTEQSDVKLQDTIGVRLAQIPSEQRRAARGHPIFNLIWKEEETDMLCITVDENPWRTLII